MDPAERELPGGGEAVFVDPETDLSVPASIADVRAAYQNTVDEVIGEWRSMFGGLGIGYELVSTDAPFGVPLRQAFAARQQLPRAFSLRSTCCSAARSPCRCCSTSYAAASARGSTFPRRDTSCAPKR